MSKYTNHDIVAALKEQLRLEFGPVEGLPLHMLLLLEQLKEADKMVCEPSDPH